MAPALNGVVRGLTGRKWFTRAERRFGEPLSSDVVHRHAGCAGLALDDVGDRARLHDLAGGGGGLAEDAVGVAAERTVEELDDLEDRDLARLAGERVAALHAALGPQHPGPPQRGEELL